MKRVREDEAQENNTVTTQQQQQQQPIQQEQKKTHLEFDFEALLKFYYGVVDNIIDFV